jgi:hypothetical protein
MRLTRFNPALMNMIKTGWAHRGIDLSNYIRLRDYGINESQKNGANQPLDMSSETRIPSESAF